MTNLHDDQYLGEDILGDWSMKIGRTAIAAFSAMEKLLNGRKPATFAAAFHPFIHCIWRRAQGLSKSKDSLAREAIGHEQMHLAILASAAVPVRAA